MKRSLIQNRRTLKIRVLGAILAASALGVVVSGCDSLRLAPSEQQKQNAWLHNRTTAIAADTARNEQASSELQSLTKLSELQSHAFTSYCGLPKEYPQAKTTEDILAQSNWKLAEAALTQSSERPDPWQVADSVLEIGIGISALLGGVYGTRAVRFLKDARAKSQALKEIIAGNEQFKKTNEAQTQAFKAAQANQSPETRQLVAQLKA
ncbi:MAG: hypothetical protein JSW27_04070 [Phycisphaerales bacterium]|nr:MAG: hypothetical protein JSW27_04070 [Phycisphaerales bacterium]